MSSTTPQFHVHVSTAGSSWDDVNSFRGMMSRESHKWQRAEVDRNGGLTLFAEDPKPFAVRYPMLICGFNGGGPIDAVTVLVEAGFGTREELSKEVFENNRVALTK